MNCNICNKNICKHCLLGGKLKLDSLQRFLKNSYQDKQAPEIDGYKRDDELSGKRVAVYHNPETKETNVIHRGSRGSKDWLINNPSYAFGLYENTDRYKHAKDIQNKAEQKYEKNNISTLGHSSGAMTADKLGKNTKNIITLNRPINLDDLLHKTTPKNQTDLRTRNDIISYFQPYQRTEGKNINIDSKTFDPIYEHKTGRLNDHDNIEVGSGIKKGAFTKNLNTYNKKHHTNLSIREFALLVKSSDNFNKAIKKRATYYLNFNQ